MHPINFSGFVVNMLLFMMGLAVAFIAIWQNRRSPTNQILAITMVAISAWAIPNGLYYLIDPFDLKPRLIVNLGATFYLIGALSFFFFVTEFENPDDRRHAFYSRVLASAWTAIVIVIIWLNHLWSQPVKNGDFYRFEATPTGTVVFVVTVLVLSLAGRNLRNSPFARNTQMLTAVTPLGIGLLLHAVFGAPIGHLLHSIFVLIGVVMVARVVLKNQLFNPLIEFTEELTAKNEQLERVNRRKSEFLANMSHELRTPLNSIIGYTELVINGVYGPLDNRLADRLEKVRGNGKSLLTLINDVLDLSKIDAGRLDLNLAYVSPVPLIDDVIATLAPLAEEKGLRVSRQYQDLPTLYVDEVRIRQVILNVFANLIKFTVSSKNLHISGYYDVQRNQVVLMLRASSGGISTADAFKINQALDSGEELRSEEFADFGLGLAVSLRLVDLHGGRIWFDEPSSTFHIAVPAASETQKRATIEAMKVTVEGDERPMILIVDDDPEAIEVMQGYLLPAGFRVYPALSGNEGLLRARELSPALIILDARMPGMDGWGVLEVLQEDDKLKEIPVIMMTAAEQSSHILQMPNVIASLIKPVQRYALTETVKNALRTPSWKI